MSDLTCPRCGSTITFLGKAPTYGFVTCDECEQKIEINPEPLPTDPIHFASGAELEAGAAKVRAMVEEIKRRR